MWVKHRALLKTSMTCMRFRILAQTHHLHPSKPPNKRIKIVRIQISEYVIQLRRINASKPWDEQLCSIAVQF